MFLANMPLADKMEESADDITAADTAPRPKKDTHTGHRYCRTSGRISFILSPAMIGLWPSTCT